MAKVVELETRDQREARLEFFRREQDLAGRIFTEMHVMGGDVWYFWSRVRGRDHKSRPANDPGGDWLSRREVPQERMPTLPPPVGDWLSRRLI